MNCSEEIKKYSIKELADYISSRLNGKVDSPKNIASTFEMNKNTGKAFLSLTSDELRD